MKNQYEIDYQQGYDKANEEWLERMDKIRAKIEHNRYGLASDGLHLALNIIDECMAESEAENDKRRDQ